MKCKICGAELNPGDTVCHVCGVIVDYHDYVNDGFSSAENRVNNSSKMTNSSFPAPSNDDFTFFSNKTNNSSSNNNEDDKTKYLIAAVIAVILLIGFGIVLVKVLSPEPETVPAEEEVILGGDDSEGGSGGKEVEDPELPETPSEPTEPTEPPVENKNYKSFEGYKFEVLDGYTVVQEQESLIFKSVADNVEFVLSIYHSNPYSTYAKRKDEVKEQWEEREYVITEYGEKTIGNVNWLIFSSTYNAKPFSIVYRTFFNNSTVELLILNNGSLSNELIYNKLEGMLSTAQVDNTATETNTKV